MQYQSRCSDQNVLHRAGSIASGFVMLLILSGCVVSGAYPESWPERSPAKRVGKCPSIAGSYRNLGIHHPSDATPLSLAEIFGVADGDRVDIAQSPDTISVSAWNAGKQVETVTFTSGEVKFGWDMNRPQTFSCPLDIPGGRVLSFAHLERGGTKLQGASYGLATFSVNAARVSKAADGSLLVKLQSGGAALIGPIPVGKANMFWYRFEPVEQ